MKVADRADTVETVLQGGEGGGLWEEHQKSIQAFVQMGILFRLQQLQSKILTSSAARHINTGERPLTGEHRRLYQLHQLIDLDQNVHCHFQLGADIVSETSHGYSHLGYGAYKI